MKWQLSKSEFFLLILIILLIVYIIISNGFRKINENSPVKEIFDTTYNHIIIDSIRYNIQIKDSIIHRIKYEYETKYIEAENLDDSSSVELFKSLCADDSLYGGENTK